MSLSNPSERLPLPAGTRRMLLDFLAACYEPTDAQARLANAPDAAIAWQAQSALDDFADFQALAAYQAANDDFAPANDNAAFGEVA
jgi:hypothetical protein